MRKNYKRVSERVHTRSIDRMVARARMKKEGFKHPNKSLSRFWREYAV